MTLTYIPPMRSFCAIAALAVGLSACGTTGNDAASRGEVTLRVADAAMSSGAPDLALRVTDILLSKQPGNIAALTARGDALYAMGQSTAASQAYRMAVKLDPHAAGAQVGLGRTLIRVDPKAAEAAFLAAATEEPGNAVALSNLGVARDLQRKHAAAQEAYRAALAVAPDMSDVRVNLGLSLALSGQADAAVQILRPLAGDPGATQTWHADLAVALAQSGDLAGARRALLAQSDPAAATPAAPAALPRLAAAAPAAEPPVAVPAPVVAVAQRDVPALTPLHVQPVEMSRTQPAPVATALRSNPVPAATVTVASAAPVAAAAMPVVPPAMAASVTPSSPASGAVVPAAVATASAPPAAAPALPATAAVTVIAAARAPAAIASVPGAAPAALPTPAVAAAAVAVPAPALIAAAPPIPSPAKPATAAPVPAAPVIAAAAPIPAPAKAATIAPTPAPAVVAAAVSLPAPAVVAAAPVQRPAIAPSQPPVAVAAMGSPAPTVVAAALVPAKPVAAPTPTTVAAAAPTVVARPRPAPAMVAIGGRPVSITPLNVPDSVVARADETAVSDPVGSIAANLPELMEPRPMVVAAARVPAPVPATTAADRAPIAAGHAVVHAEPGRTSWVQVAAVRSEHDVQYEWHRLQTRMPDLLRGRSLSIAHGEAHGHTFWRLRTGGFASVAEANALCQELRAVGANCLTVVTP